MNDNSKLKISLLSPGTIHERNRNAADHHTFYVYPGKINVTPNGGRTAGMFSTIDTLFK